MSPPPPIPNFTSHYSIPYSSLTILNTLDIHLPTTPPPSTTPSYALIYIHGGAYRDPLQTSLTLLPALPFLPPSLSAIASINYRLSPHPDHPPTSLSDAAARSARWPDPLDDVCAAIIWLGSAEGGGKWGWPLGKEMVLAGHSVGGTLAFRAAGAGAARAAGEEVVVGVVSIAGIADFRVLRDEHLHAKELYEEFTRAALGEEERWEEGRTLREGVPAGVKVVVLGQGRGDRLVEWGQVEILREGVEKGWGGRVKVLELEGGHEDLWKKGKEVARCVAVAVGMLIKGKGVGIEMVG